MDKDIQKDVLFAIPAYSKVMPKYFEKRSAILRRIQTLIKEDRPNDASEYRSCEQLHLDKDPDIQWLMQRLANIAAGCINEHNSDFLINHEVHLLSSWVNVMPAGIWSKPESHSQFDWSGIFYAHVSEPTPKDPGLIFLNPYPHKQKWAKQISINIDAKEGMVILFPAHLTHMLVPHNEKHTRLSVAFNLRILPCSPIPSIIGHPKQT